MSKRKASDVFLDASFPVTKAAKQTQLCNICSVDKASCDFPSSALSHNQHENKACLECWDRYIWLQVDSGGLTQVRCFFCEKFIDIGDLPMLLTPSSMPKFEKALNLAAVKNAPNYRECPSASCQYGYILLSQGEAVSNCRYCSQSHCNHCDVPMHKGQSCEAFQQRLKGEDADTLELLKLKSKTCPKCGIHIQKNGGCAHMFCIKCKHRFCWGCSAPLSGRCHPDCPVNGFPRPSALPPWRGIPASPPRNDPTWAFPRVTQDEIDVALGRTRNPPAPPPANKPKLKITVKPRKPAEPTAASMRPKRRSPHEPKRAKPPKSLTSPPAQAPTPEEDAGAESPLQDPNPDDNYGSFSSYLQVGGSDDDEPVKAPRAPRLGR